MNKKIKINKALGIYLIVFIILTIIGWLLGDNIYKGLFLGIISSLPLYLLLLTIDAASNFRHDFIEGYYTIVYKKCKHNIINSRESKHRDTPSILLYSVCLDCRRTLKKIRCFKKVN